MKVYHEIGGSCHTYGVTSGADERWCFALLLLWNCVPIGVIAVVKGRGGAYTLLGEKVNI
jgi:hypothetical protein